MRKTIIGIIVAVLPLYSFISWINIFSNDKLNSQEARVTEYRKMFFSLFNNVNIITFLNIILSITSIYLLGSNFSKMKRSLKVFSSLLIIVMFILILFNIWSLL